ncbi:autotransporter outer membrane beta-barrel domain-containing protein [Chelatococcus sp. GCM10030263]|uniref:autotransporter outer membrane beta-barrel domain-containing protein n=1 Tax=Chelatococcus sp. GCM10030263 TaxID=3273387 RepID=UPI00361BC512
MLDALLGLRACWKQIVVGPSAIREVHEANAAVVGLRPAAALEEDGVAGLFRTVLVAMLGVAAFARLGSAADLPPSPPTQPAALPGWTFQATFYGWLTALDGTVGVRNLPPAKVDASISDVLEKLDGAVMGSFLAKNGDWMILTDLIWSQLSDDATLNVADNPTAKFKQRLLIASAIAGYRLPLGNPDLDLSVTAGLRYQRLTLDATLTPGALPALSFSNEQRKDWIDPIVGLALQYRMADRWFLNGLVDIGGFGVGSQITSQGFVSVGYKWTESLSTAVGYRVLYTDYEASGNHAGTFRYDTTMHGPFVSMALHF